MCLYKYGSIWPDDDCKSEVVAKYTLNNKYCCVLTYLTLEYLVKHIGMAPIKKKNLNKVS
jgi:hypothetical protein